MNFSTLAMAAETPDLVLHQSITAADAKELNIQIPDDVTPGYKTLEVNVSGMGKATQMQTVLFCKDSDQVIHWDNQCPGLSNLVVMPPVENLLSRESYLPYDPLDNPKETTSTVIIAFAALGLVAGAGAVANNLALRENIPKTQDSQQGYLAGLSKGSALLSSTQLGRGDKAGLWAKPRMQKMDQIIHRTGNRISGFSPLATRILSDGNYQRSLIGPFALLVYPAAIALGIFASTSMDQQALPPSIAFILAMMVIGVIDAFAGVLLSLAFVLSIAIGGNLNNFDSVMTVAGICLLAFSPALLAGAFRPMRRAVWDFTSLWERGTDYLLASILTGWVVQQIVLGLPGLSGLQLPITEHARFIAIVAVLLIIARFILEDFALRLFPQRLITMDPQYRERTILQQILATIFKVAIFATVSGKFLGLSAQLFIGVALFSIPLILGIFEDKFPKSTAVKKWMPTGIIEMLVMTLSGLFIASLVQDRYPNGKNYVLICFVLLSLPGLILKILALFGEDGAEDWKITQYGRVFYRILGVVALAVLIYIILSGLLLSNHF